LAVPRVGGGDEATAGVGESARDRSPGRRRVHVPVEQERRTGRRPARPFEDTVLEPVRHDPVVLLASIFADIRMRHRHMTLVG